MTSIAALREIRDAGYDGPRNGISRDDLATLLEVAEAAEVVVREFGPTTLAGYPEGDDLIAAVKKCDFKERA
jgi:hypothetical protein